MAKWLQICGNGCAVAELQHWLAAWQETAETVEAAAATGAEAGPPTAAGRRRGARNAAIFSSDDEWLDDGSGGAVEARARPCATQVPLSLAREGVSGYRTQTARCFFQQLHVTGTSTNEHQCSFLRASIPHDQRVRSAGPDS